MNNPGQVRFILLEEFVKAQAKNPYYSMRAYSQKLGIAQSAVSEILAGKRPITKKTAKKILEGLDKDPDQVSNLLESVESGQTQKYQTLDMDTFHVISDWFCFAILSLSETKDFQSSESWIAERLGISQNDAASAIAKLLRLQLLEKDTRTGRLTSTGQQFEAVSAIANPALKKANRQNLDLASNAFETIALSERDFTAITLCFDPNRMEDARKMIKAFRRNFNRVMESGHKKEVYKLCIQLFPLSKKRGLK
jgi:uncharacterized protein (TIGR02147 family)